MSDLAKFVYALLAPESLKSPEPNQEADVPKYSYPQRPFNLETDGIVTEAIVPGQLGQIEYRGSWWLAQCQYPLVLPVGTIVFVISAPSIPLEVEPIYFPFQN